VSEAATTVDVAILGAGVSGLCLARALADGPLRDLTVLLVDGARDDDELRTLSYWARGATALDDLEARRWTTLRVHDGARAVDVPLREHSYRTVFFAELQRAVKRRFAGDPRLRLVEGRAGELADGDDGATFSVGGERVRARWVFDSRFARRELAVDPRRWHLLWQHFHGWIVRAERDVFDPTAADFLDFRTGLSLGDTFFYVLPFSPREALVELVSFAPVDAEAAVARWLDAHAGLRPGEYTFERREAGVSPMTEQPFARAGGRRIRRIGVAGGRLKASTGYALTRILDDCDAIVARSSATATPSRRPPSGGSTACSTACSSSSGARGPRRCPRCSRRCSAGGGATGCCASSTSGPRRATSSGSSPRSRSRPSCGRPRAGSGAGCAPLRTFFRLRP
jgi:lycopene beta-cyclase